jgi:hypothetical protein
MNRIIRPGPRPAVAFGTMALVLGAFLLHGALSQHRLDLVEGWLIFVASLGIILIRIYAVRIEVTDDHISRVDGFWLRQTVRFDQIDRSVPQALTDGSRPLWLDIYPLEPILKAKPLRLPLNSCRPADVSWLLCLKALKVRS